MSFVLSQKIIRSQVGLTSTEKLTLLSIADRIDDKGYSFPSVGLIAKEVGVNVRSIRRVIKKLQGKDLLGISRNTGRSNHYRVNDNALIPNLGDDTHDTPTPVMGDTPPLLPVTAPPVTHDTLIYKIIDNTTDKGNKAGAPLDPTTPTKRVEGKVKTLDSIKTAIDGTGLRQKKVPHPKNVWLKAVSEWRTENEIEGSLIPMTQADAGKLNTVAKKVGSEFNQTLRYCVSSWTSFVKHTRKATGSDWKTSQPDINYFVKNINSALTFTNTEPEDIDTKCNEESLLG